MYCTTPILNFLLFPFSTSHVNNTDIYNKIFSLNNHIENIDISFCLEYKSILKSIEKNHKIANPSIQTIYDILVTAIQLSTFSFRFPETLNSSIRRMAVNLNLYPRLHFYNLGMVPLKFTDINVAHQKAYTEDQICSQLFSNDNNLTLDNVEKGINLCSSLHFFSKINYFEIEKSI